MYHTDHLGSSTYLTDNFGRPSHYYETLPFGEMMVEHNQSKYYKSPYPTTNIGKYDNKWKFNGKELDDATGMYYYGARYYDPRISIFVSVDPLAEQFQGWTPYHYVHNNPINLIDPTGMSAQGPHDPPGGDESTLLPELVINVDRKVSGSAQGTHVETTDTGQRFYGYKVEGQAGGKYGKIDGHLSGFSFGYDGNTERGGIHGSASVYALTGRGGIRLGTKDNNFSIVGDGSVFRAEAKGDAGLYTGKTGKYGAELGGELGAYAFKGDITPSVSIFGVTMGITIGGSYGSAHIGARGAGIFNSNTKEFESTAEANIGLGAGLKLGFTISNRKQEIHGSIKNNKKKK